MLIKEIVENLIRKHKTNCPFALAKALDINVVYENLGETMGYFTNDYRIKFIHINQRLTQDEPKFTCAHELAHAVLHPNVNTPFLKRHTLFSTDKIERQANTFAVELLLPDDLIREHADCGFFNLAKHVGIPDRLVILKQK